MVEVAIPIVGIIAMLINLITIVQVATADVPPTISKIKLTTIATTDFKVFKCIFEVCVFFNKHPIKNYQQFNKNTN